MQPQASIAVPTLPSVVWAILLAVISMGPFLLFLWWLTRRDRQRQWALQQQV